MTRCRVVTPPRTLTFYYRGRRPDGTGSDYDIGGSGLRVKLLEVEGIFRLSTSLPGIDGNKRKRREVEQFPGDYDCPLDALRAFAKAYGYEVAYVDPRPHVDPIQILPAGNVPSEREYRA